MLTTKGLNDKRERIGVKRDKFGKFIKGTEGHPTKHSDETKKKMSKNYRYHTNVGCFKKGCSGFTGNHSEKTKERLRKINLKDGFISNKGYKVLCFRGKYIREHHKVWCDANGLQRIPKGFIIHHIDGYKLNNDQNNLLMLLNGFHTKLHWEIKRR